MNGAFKDLIQGTFIVHIYIDRPNENTILNIAKMIPFGFPFSSILIVVSLLAFFIHGLKKMVNSKKAGLPDNPFLPFITILSLLLIASLIDFQGHPDFFVSLPFCCLGVVILYRAFLIDMVKKSSQSTSGFDVDIVKSLFFLILLFYSVLERLVCEYFLQSRSHMEGRSKRDRREHIPL